MDKKTHLKELVSNNYDLEKPESILNEFNPLSVLRVDHYEIRHSNILSWLLDPNGNHRMGDTFLKKILYSIVTQNDILNSEIDIFKIQDLSFHKIEVKREWKNIDILLIDHSNELVIFIENKVHSTESEGQLDKYYEIVNNHFKTYKKIPVYLTLYGDEPSNQKYGTLDYSNILEILKITLELNKDFLNSKVYDFITYYYKSLKMLTMEDQEIRDLCKKIYKNHKEALDLIYEHSSEDEFETASEEFSTTLEFVEKFIDWKAFWLIPKEVASHCKKIAHDWSWGYPVAFRFVKKEEKMGLVIEVGPFIDGDKRSEFLTHLRNYNYVINDRSILPTSKHTRIFTVYPHFEEWDDKELIKEKFAELYEDYMKEHIDRLSEACKAFSWV